MPNPKIAKASDLVTSREKTRAGFIAIALEKNYYALPYIDEAKKLKVLASKAANPNDLVKMPEIKAGLIAAAGLSDKSLAYLTEKDQNAAIQGLIDKFLLPAGDQFVEELIYRFLLIKGDSLGGKMRNIAGALGAKKFLRSLISSFNLAGIEYLWKDSETKVWSEKPKDDSDLEKRACAFSWKRNGNNRLLLQNIKVPTVDKNVDICLFNEHISNIKKDIDLRTLIKNDATYLALGELKGGIDPAGADEHWKTANTALGRIRKGFSAKGLNPNSFFIGAAIENSMADEIFNQLQDNSLTYAANLSDEEQLTSVCNWIINL